MFEVTESLSDAVTVSIYVSKPYSTNTGKYYLYCCMIACIIKAI